MAGVFESIKRLYNEENKTKHWIIFGVIFIFSLLSMAFDAAIGKPETAKQNPVDVLISIALGFYSLHFLHAALINPVLPLLSDVKKLKWEALGGMILISIVWSFYFILIALLAVLWMLITKDFILPVIIVLLTAFAAPFMTFIYMAFAENFSFIELLNPKNIFKTIKPGFAPLYINLIKYTMVGLLIVVFFALIYVIFDIIKIPVLNLAYKGVTVLDAIIVPLCIYMISIIIYFLFPYSLIDVYREKIRPALYSELSSAAVEKYPDENEQQC